MDHENDVDQQPPTPVAPPPSDVAPSATGLIIGDEKELEEAPPSPELTPAGMATAGRVGADPASPLSSSSLAGSPAAKPASDSSTGTASADGPSAPTGTSFDLALGVVRVGVGAALIVAPGWAGRIWVGPGADGPGSLVFARALGARDVALGVRIITGVRKGEPVGHWVASGFVADAADVVASVIAGRHLTPGRRRAMPVVAGAVGVAGAWSVRRSGRSA